MRCPACPVPAGSPCRGESDRPEFCGPAWAGSGDGTLLRHIRAVADDRPKPTAPRMAPLTALAVDCLYRDPGCASCRGIRCWADRGDREHGRATTLSNCERCVGQLVPFRRD